MKKREFWLDYLRAFACILVTLGHMFMGLRDSSICDNSVVTYGIDLIYHFHVYIFFFCSGYLLQKNFSKSTNKRMFLSNKMFRCLDFVSVYIIFTGVTFFVKMILSNSVNSPVEYTFSQTLLKHPINQMWYLYAIAVITLCTPMIRSKGSMVILLLVSMLLKVAVGIPGITENLCLPLRYLCSNQIWYVIGSVWSYKKFVPQKWMIFATTSIFIVVNTFLYFKEIHNYIFDTILTFLGISAASMFFFIWREKKLGISCLWKLIAKYMLQIYLLHTICAAGIRIILLKFGISNILIHIILGIVFSFGIPILGGMIAEKTKILNIVFYPTRTIQQICKQKPNN